MDMESRLQQWWERLDVEHQALALGVTEEVPPWMVSSLDQAGIVVVDADLTGNSHVSLLPTRLREFLDLQAPPNRAAS